MTAQFIIRYDAQKYVTFQISDQVTAQFIFRYTYMTGNTFGKTTEPSARYWYRVRVSTSSVLCLTSVARTQSINACVEESVITSGLSRMLPSPLDGARSLPLRF